MCITIDVYQMTGGSIMQTESEQLFEESKKYIPGGVNSPVRAFGSVGRSPIFIKKAKGSRIFDEDGRDRESSDMQRRR